MFKRIEVRGYGPFGDAVLDMSGPKGSCDSLALIYGENGSGKTAIADTVRFLRMSVGTLSDGRSLADGDAMSSGEFPLDDGGLCSADLMDLASAEMSAITGEGMELVYAFAVKGSDAEYSLRFSRDGRLIAETLHCRPSKRRICALSVTPEGVELNRIVFPDAGYRRALEGLLAGYWGPHSLMAMIHRDLCRASGDAVQGMVHRALADILCWIDSVSVRTAKGSMPSGILSFMRDGMESGSVMPPQERMLDAASEVVSDFFIRLCGDYQGAYYRKRTDGKAIRYELFVRKMVQGHLIELPISSESSGVRRLLSFLPSMIACAQGRVTVVDEMDAGTHELLFRSILKSMLQDSDGQLIVTTHNTTFMEFISPRNIHIIRCPYMMDRSISRISDMVRTQRTNNNRNRYTCGLLDGVPYSSSLELRDMIECYVEDVGA